MSKKYMDTTINRALYLGKELKFTREGGIKGLPHLSSSEIVEAALSETRVVTPGGDRCGL